MKIHLFDQDESAREFPTGTSVFSEGDAATEMYAVVSGSVDILVRGQVVETVTAGGVFGEMALIEQRPRSAAARVREAARIVAIDEKRFLFLVQQNPFFSLQLMTVMAERLRRMDERL